MVPAQNVDVQKMLDGHQSTLLELLQWMFKFLGDKRPVDGYDASARRRMSKHGGCNSIPRFGVSEAAFKRWSVKQGAAHNASVACHNHIADPVELTSCALCDSCSCLSTVLRQMTMLLFVR
jgi:hypothetical protein